MTSNVDLMLYDLVGADQEVLHRDVLLDRVGGAIEFPRAITRQFENSLAQGLGRDGAEIDADAAEDARALNDGDALVELGTLDGGALAGRTRADHQQIIVITQRHCATPSMTQCLYRSVPEIASFTRRARRRRGGRWRR